MVVSLVNSVEFYTHLSSSGYFNGIGRTAQVRPKAEGNSPNKDINQVNFSKIASEKIGAGTDPGQKTIGVYVDVLHPQYTRQSPISKSGEPFKSVLEVLINRPGLNSRIYSRPATKNPEGSTNVPSKAQEFNVQQSGFVITVPGGHMDKLNENRSDSLQNKLYDLYNNNSQNYSGSLVNVTV